MRTLVVQTLTGAELTVEVADHGATVRDVKRALRDVHAIKMYHQRLLLFHPHDKGVATRLASDAPMPADVSRLLLIFILHGRRGAPPEALDLAVDAWPWPRWRHRQPWQMNITLAECTRTEALRQLRSIENLVLARRQGYHQARTPARALDLAMPFGILELPRRKHNAWHDGTTRRYPLVWPRLPCRKHNTWRYTSAGHVTS
jgi:hypothetical protein